MNRLAKSISTVATILTLTAAVSATSHSIGDLTPSDDALLDDTSVELGAKATHPNGGDLNVTFYTGAGDRIGQNTSSGTLYNLSWNVGGSGQYTWYAEAVDGDDDIAQSGTRTFTVDTNAPSVSFDSAPDSSTSEQSPTFSVSSESEDAKFEYKLDNGDFTDVADPNEFRQQAEFQLSDLSDGDHTVTVRAGDRAGNTGTGERTFTVDTNAPDVSFSSTPDSPTSDQSPSVEVSSDEVVRLDYRVDGGQYTDVGGESSGFGQSFEFQLSDLSGGDHTVTVRGEDRFGNTGTSSFSFRVVDGSEISFNPATEQSYPQSGIPINPRSDVFGTDTEVDFDFSLERSGESYDISNDIGDGVCDFNGNAGWTLGGINYCGSEVPEDIDTGVEYELVAEWSLRGEDHRKIIAPDFLISTTNQWYSQSSSHGGRVDSSAQANTNIDGIYEERDGEILACTGTSYEVEDISTVEARCSNGHTVGSRTPPVVSFVTEPSGTTEKSNNNMFNDGGCNVEDGVSRQNLLEGRKNEGYYPPGCNVDWQLGGDESFTAYTFEQPGRYGVAVDYVNAVSDSPNYICPAKSNNNACDVGAINGASGWKNIDQETVNIIEPRIEVDRWGLSQNSATQKVNGDTYVRREDYTGTITGTIDVRNPTTASIEITGLDLDCPSDVDCEVVSNLDLEISEGETSTITWRANPSGRTTGPLSIAVQYQDAYDLGCPTTNVPTKTYYLDEADPDTDQGVN